MRQRTLQLGIILIGLSVGLGGCVASESSRYTHKLSSVVESKPASDGEVATAFGLDKDAAPPAAVAEASVDQ